MIKQASQGIKETLNDRINLVKICKGILLSYIITIPLFLLFAFILTYTNFPEKYITPVVVIVTIISIFMAGTIATRSLKSKGWLNGGVVGVFYMIVLYVVSSIIFKNFAIDKHVISMLIIGLLTGSIGGIVGINAKRTRHRKPYKLKK